MSIAIPVRFASSIELRRVCPDCGFIRPKLLSKLSSREHMRLNDLVEHRSFIKRRAHVHRSGSAFKWLYFVHSGFLKTAVMDNHGRQQTVSFKMAGDPVGLEAIGRGIYDCDTVALEDSRVCGIRYFHFEQLARDIPALQQHVQRLMGQEIAGTLGMTHLLRGMDAEDRVATFLLNLSGRFTARDSSGIRFRLPMSRRDIASLLGLTLETVSRVFSHFGNLQIIATRNKDIEIRSLTRLRQLIGNRNSRRHSLRRAATGPNGNRPASLAPHLATVSDPILTIATDC